MRKMLEIVGKVDGNVMPIGYDMTLKEVQALAEVAKEDLVVALGIAFKYGFALGKRAYKNGSKKTV